ncbi:MAG: response regulator [Syntrophomonas sp.]
MIKAVVVDDERPACDDLVNLLQTSGMAQVTASFTEPREALRYVANHKIDAVFLDIEMPEMDGLELSSHIISLPGNIAVIFVTAYNHYAVEAFRLNALDYLMKPVAEERLHETLNRIVKEKNIPMRDEKLQVRCFGKFTVETGTGPVKFRTEKAEELFAFLLDQRGKFITRSNIIDCLWEEFDGEKALINFNTTLHYVKKALFSHGVEIHIEYERGNYRLDPSELDCDYFQFYGLASHHTRVTTDSIGELEAAAGLYTGDYLAGKESIWSVRSRHSLKDLYIGLLLRLAEYYKANGQHEKTAEWMKNGLMHEPLHRELNYNLIEALLLTGDRLSALQYYELYKRGFIKKMQREPDLDFRIMFG